MGEIGYPSISVRRSAAEGERRVVGNRDVERRIAADAGVAADDAVPDGRARTADRQSRRLRGGRGGGVDVIARDREDLAVLEVIREGGVVVARALGDVAGDRNVILAGDNERGVVGPGDRLRDREVGAIGEDAAIADADRADCADAVRRKAKEATVGVEAAAEGVGDRGIEDPDATVVLVDRERAVAAAELVGQRRRDHVEVRVHAAELEGLDLGGGVRRVRIGRIIDQVRDDQRARAARLDTAGAAGTGQVDCAGRDFTRTHINERHGVGTPRIAELKPTAADIGAKAGRRRVIGPDGGDDQAFVAENGVTRIRVQVTEDEVRPALLRQRTRTADDAGDRGEIEAGVAVISDVEIMPATARDCRRAGESRGGSHLADRELRGVIKAGDVGTRRDSRDPTDYLAHREHRHVAAVEVNRARTRSNRLKGRGGARSRRDDEVPLELDVSRGGQGIEADGRATEEVRRAGSARAPDRVGERREVDDELGDIGGKGRGTVRRPDPPLAGAGAEGSAEGASALEAAVIILEGKIRGRRQGEAVLGDERPAREARVTGIGVSLVPRIHHPQKIGPYFLYMDS